MRLLNTELLASPYNWASILLMVLFGLFLISMLSPQSE